MCSTFFFTLPSRRLGPLTRTLQCCFIVAETNKTDPTQYLLTLEQMIENDYPIPSYMADVFEKSAGWMETPQPAENESKWNQKIYAIDCEMVRDAFVCLLLSVQSNGYFFIKVYHGGRKGIDASVCD